QYPRGRCRGGRGRRESELGTPAERRHFRQIGSAWYSVNAVAPPPPPSLPPACADCTATLQSSQPGSLPQKMSYSMSRSADGKMRIDYPNSSVITNPATGQMQLLDHVKKEVTTIPLPAAVPPQVAAQLQAPGMPGAPTPPGAPPMSV